MIPGGYYIKARKINDSEISYAPPHVREIWDYLLREANHKDGKSSGRIIRRGQLFTSYEEIQKALSWKIGFRKKCYEKHHCETAMKTLRKAAMITTTKTTRGMIITICNYDYYQDPRNYDNRNDNRNDNPDGTVREPHYKQEEKKKEERTINTYVQNFDLFWEKYPKKTGKGSARKAFAKIKKPEEVIKEILKALEWQIDSMEWKREGGQYIPLPSTYLNQCRWEDEPYGNNGRPERHSTFFGKRLKAERLAEETNGV